MKVRYPYTTDDGWTIRGLADLTDYLSDHIEDKVLYLLDKEISSLEKENEELKLADRVKGDNWEKVAEGYYTALSDLCDGLMGIVNNKKLSKSDIINLLNDYSRYFDPR